MENELREFKMYHERLTVYQVALSVAEEISKAGARWPRGMGYLIDQLRRAMASIVLNICEGNGREGQQERRRFFSIAKGSTAEVAACIDLAKIFGLLDQDAAARLKAKLYHIDRMLWGLIK